VGAAVPSGDLSARPNTTQWPLGERLPHFHRPLRRQQGHGEWFRLAQGDPEATKSELSTINICQSEGDILPQATRETRTKAGVHRSW